MPFALTEDSTEILFLTKGNGVMEPNTRPPPWASWLQCPVPSTVGLQVQEWEMLPAWGCVRTQITVERRGWGRWKASHGWGVGDKHLACRKR